MRGNKEENNHLNTTAQKIQIARINRSLAKTNEFRKLRTSRGWREVQNLGTHHIVDVHNNSVIDHHVDLDALEEELKDKVAEPTYTPQSKTVTVRRQWNDWRLATVNMDSLSGVHWDTYSGGVNAKAPRPFLHAYMSCDAVLEGEIAHSCMHGEGPHMIKVCIVKKDNGKDIFERLRQAA